MLTIINNDCLTAMREMADNSIDAIVTDPPYGLSFMGKKWDYDVPSVEIWLEAFRVLKPGGHLLAFAGTRTQHRMAVNIEDAGFDIRDMIMWVYGSGFPKSLDIGKAIDKAAGAKREVIDTVKKMPSAGGANTNEGWKRPWAEGKTTMEITAPATPEARQWNGWGTAMKPAVEPITVARKPVEGTVADNVLKWGTGGINIDGCRVGMGTGQVTTYKVSDMRGGNFGQDKEAYSDRQKLEYTKTDKGRFPANFIHDGSEEVVGLFPRTTSGGGNGNRRGHGPEYGDNTYGNYNPKNTTNGIPPDSGTAARFFYTAKASKAERDAGCEGLEERESKKLDGGTFDSASTTATDRKARNHHPTVKPIDLMRYLCRLVTPPGGTILDPFAGSGTTLVAAHYEGFSGIGIEREKEYAEIAEKRIQGHTAQTRLF